jgi:hypothetical protein
MDFKNCQSDVQALIHAIGFLGPDIVGVELGVFEGSSFMTLLHNCPNIKTLHGVDSYQAYDDYIKNPYDGEIALRIDQPRAEITRSISFIRQKYSGMTHKIVFHEEDTLEACKKFEDESIDFIFMDSYLSYEQAKKELIVWYPKMKKGGLFAGHDWDCPAVQKAVNEFRIENKISSGMTTYNDTWSWKV